MSRAPRSNPLVTKMQGDAAGDPNPKSKAKVQPDTYKPEGKPGKGKKAIPRKNGKRSRHG